MTTVHKVVLSLIAAVCITLIVFYSVKGNNQRPQPVAVVNTPGVSATPQQIEAKAQADEQARAKAMSQPVLVGPSAMPPGASIDDLVAKVRSEIAADAPIQGGAGTTSPALTSSTTPGADSAPVATANVPTAVVLSEASRTNATDDSFADDAPAVTLAAGPAPLPLNSATSLPVASATANSAELVPSFTLGEPPRRDRVANAEDESDRHAAEIEAARSRDLIDGPINELVHITGSRDPLPPLVRIRTDDEPRANGDSAVKSDESKSPVIVVDPHKVAVKAEEPVAQVAKPSQKTSTEEATAAANSASISPIVAVPIKPVPPSGSQSVASSPSSSASPLKSYTVKAGDSFSSIAVAELGAERHWLAIEDANPGVDPKRIRVGQVINLPNVEEANVEEASVEKANVEKANVEKDSGKPAASSPATTAATTSKPATTKPAATSDSKPAPVSEAKLHEVRAGENLSSISRRYFNTPDHWRHIYLTNRDLIGSDPGKLKAGVKLKITTPAPN